MLIKFYSQLAYWMPADGIIIQEYLNTMRRPQGIFQTQHPWAYNYVCHSLSLQYFTHYSGLSSPSFPSSYKAHYTSELPLLVIIFLVAIFAVVPYTPFPLLLFFFSEASQREYHSAAQLPHY